MRRLIFRGENRYLNGKGMHTIPRILGRSSFSFQQMTLARAEFIDVEIKSSERSWAGRAKSLEDYLNDARTQFAPMIEADGSTWYNELQWAMDIWRFESRDLGIVPSGGCAMVGRGLFVTDDRGITYTLKQRRWGAMTADVRKDGVHVITLNKFGRWNNDPKGWDPDRRIIAGIISFPRRSNLGGLLSAVVAPPSLPFREKASVVVFTSADGTPFPTSAVFAWSTLVPRPKIMAFRFTVSTADEGEKKLWVSVWDGARAELAGSETSLSGMKTYDMLALFRVPTIVRSGFLEITPTGAPEGVIVENIDFAIRGLI